MFFNCKRGLFFQAISIYCNATTPLCCERYFVIPGSCAMHATESLTLILPLIPPTCLYVCVPGEMHFGPDVTSP